MYWKIKKICIAGLLKLFFWHTNSKLKTFVLYTYPTFILCRSLKSILQFRHMCGIGVGYLQCHMSFHNLWIGHTRLPRSSRIDASGFRKLKNRQRIAVCSLDDNFSTLSIQMRVYMSVKSSVHHCIIRN